MGDKIRKWIAVLLAGSILAMIQLVPAGGAVFVRENIENKEILGEKETSLQQTLHARAWVLMDADSGRILAGKDADTAYPMASTTKILTCILALEQGNPDDWVEVSEKAGLHAGCPAQYAGGGAVPPIGSTLFPDAGIPQRQRRGGGGAHRGKCGRICGENEPESVGDRM